MKTDLKKVMSHLWKNICNQKLLALLLLISLLIVQVSNLVIPIYYGKIFDSIYNAKWIDLILNTIYLQIFIILWLNLTNLIAYRFMDYFNMKFELKMDIDNYFKNFNYLQAHSYNFFTNNFVGSLTKKLSRYVYAMAELLAMIIYDIAWFIIGILFVIWYIFYKNIYLWFIVLAFFLFIFGFQWMFYKFRHKLNLKAIEQDTKLSWILADDISNNFNIKIFGNLNRESKYFKEEAIKWAGLWEKYWFIGNIWFWVLTLFIVILEFLIFYIWIWFWKDWFVWVWFFVVVQIYLFDIFRKLYSVWHIINKFFKITADAQEMIEILETPHELIDRPNSKDIIINKWELEFKNVWFYYKNEKYIFEDFNLKIKAWEKVAFVWVSGSGKTTLSRLIIRLYDIQKWSILIDWQDISQVKQESLRRQISLVPQEPMLFHRSIAENIAYGVDHASMDEIIHVAKLAQAHEFISKLEKWYESLVWERGIKLSGGERQRVAIARAILQKNKLLIMDEATSSLDSESEKHIQDAIDNVLKNKTAIVIAHRLSTIMKMDRIIVLQHGKIIEDGTHNELLKKQNGIYKKLWNIQAWGFLIEQE